MNAKHFILGNVFLVITGILGAQPFASHSGGIVGIFRQGSPKNQRTVMVQFLDPTSVYEVRKAPTGEVIIQTTGKELAEKRIPVNVRKKN